MKILREPKKYLKFRKNVCNLWSVHRFYNRRIHFSIIKQCTLNLYLLCLHDIINIIIHITLNHPIRIMELTMKNNMNLFIFTCLIATILFCLVISDRFTVRPSDSGAYQVSEKKNVTSNKADALQNAIPVEPLLTHEVSFQILDPNNCFYSIGIIDLGHFSQAGFEMRPCVSANGVDYAAILRPNDRPNQYLVVENSIFAPYKKHLHLFGVVVLGESEKDFTLVSANDKYLVFKNSKGELFAKKIQLEAGEKSTVPYSSISSRDKETQMTVLSF